MLIKQIVTIVATFLNMPQVINYLQNGQVSGNALEEIDALTRLTNLVISELAVAGFYLVKSQTVTPLNGKITYANLLERPIKIIKATDANGVEHPFTAHTEYLLTNDEVTEITYAYSIYNEGLDSKITFEDYRLTEVTIAMGVSAEYLLTQNDFDNAVAWHDKFISALGKLRKVKNTTVKERSFV